MPAARADHVPVAVVPAAAALVLLASRLLTIDLPYRDAGLGIVSLTALSREPAAERIVWFVLAVGAGLLLAWVALRALRRVGLPEEQGLAVEALGAGALLAALYLSPLPGTILALTCIGGATALAVRAAPMPEGGELRPTKSRAMARPLGRPFECLLLLSIAAAFSGTPGGYPGGHPGLFGGLSNVLHGVPDTRLTVDLWAFHAESGQHLHWIDRLREGERPGRDFFCLYGPLYDLSGLALQQMLGRSLAANSLWEALAGFGGMLGLLALCARLVERRASLLAIPCLVGYVTLRLGLPLAGLSLLAVWRQTGRTAWCAGAGVVAGISLLYSQEFGLAYLLSAGLLLLLCAEPAALFAFALGAAASVAPVLCWLAWEGALAPMLADLTAYPRWVAAGYGNLPAPSLKDHLPLRPGGFESDAFVRVFFAVPAVLVGALAIALPLALLDPLRPLESLARFRRALQGEPGRFEIALVALFGLIAYRSALGRSDLFHVISIMGPAAALLCVGLDRCLALRGTRPRVAALRGALLLVVVVEGAYLSTARPWVGLGQAAGEVRQLAGLEAPPRSSTRVLEMVERVKEITAPGEEVLFLPDLASAYYLTRRSNPTRFALSHQMVTDAHRAETLLDLRARPPRFVVWNSLSLKVDGIGPERYLGAELDAWLWRHYAPVWSRGGFRIFEYRGAAGDPP